MYLNLIIIKTCSIQQLKSDSPSSHHPSQKPTTLCHKKRVSWMVNGNYLTINNALFLSTSKVSSKDPPPTATPFFLRGDWKRSQKKNITNTKKPTTQRGGKKTHKKTPTPPPPWNLCMESLHIFFFIHLDPRCFCPIRWPLGNSAGSATQAWASSRKLASSRVWAPEKKAET